LTVTPTHLLFTLRDYLAVYDRGMRAWSTYGEIKPAPLAGPVVVGDCVYLLVAEPPGNALIRFNLGTRAMEILASTRRRPAASPLDDPIIQLKTIATNEASEIVVTAGKLRQIWSPQQRQWRPDPSGPTRPATAPQRGDVYRTGSVQIKDEVPILRLNRKEASMLELPLQFAPPGGTSLPESRYGPQKVMPHYCNAFPGGMLLVPRFASGFWVIPQVELDEYLRRVTGTSKSAEAK
jgi:hypothetical protein